jgi:hypothetical protein
LAGVLPEAGLEMAPVDLGDLSMTESAGEDEDLQYNDDKSATSDQIWGEQKKIGNSLSFSPKEGLDKSTNTPTCTSTKKHREV